jgi:hypothetical protein
LQQNSFNLVTAKTLFMKYLLTAILAITILSCDKDKNDEPSKTDQISSAKWKYDDAGVDNNGDGTIDVSFSAGILPACVTDNEVSFSANGTGIADEGATKCDVSDPQTTNFSWNFTNNENSINISDNGLFGISGQFGLLDLDAAQFKLKKDTTIAPFGAVSLVVKLKH